MALFHFVTQHHVLKKPAETEIVCARKTTAHGGKIYCLSHFHMYIYKISTHIKHSIIDDHVTAFLQGQDAIYIFSKNRFFLCFITFRWDDTWHRLVKVYSDVKELRIIVVMDVTMGSFFLSLKRT